MHDRRDNSRGSSSLTAARRPCKRLLVFVDRDGKVGRERQLNEAIKDLRIPNALGVAIESFESWLLADTSAVVELLRPAAGPSANPESLPPGEAKRLLQQWCVDAGQDPLSLRRDLARHVDLGALRECCTSFAVFQRALFAALGQ